MTLNGIDISNWQAGINVPAVDADFVIVKATQGTDYTSPSMRSQADSTLSAGKLLGFYHYASGTSATAEADYFVNTIRDYIGRALLALDFEMGENSAWDSNPNQWIKSFCDRVAETTGVKPLVYIPASGLNRTQGIGDYGLWVAQYADNNPTGYQDTPWNEGAYACAMRQYSSAGRIGGYNGNLDLNKFYGDREAWNKYANPTGNATVQQTAQTAVDIEALARDVIAGKYGDGQNRRAALGSNYEAVQARVNQILGAGQQVVHTVARGETLSGIAAKYGTSWQHLAQTNNLANPNLIYAGQKIRIK